MRFKFCPHCGDSLIKKEIGDEGSVPFCRKCNEALFDIPVSCTMIFAVNEYGEAVLIKQGKYKDYGCISGYMKIGESAEDCTVREVKEEIGIKPYDVEYAGSYTFDEKEMIMLGFIAYVKKSEFMLSDEVKQAEWFEIKEAVNKLRDNTVGKRFAENCIERIDKNGR